MIWLVLALALFAIAFVGVAWARLRARRAVHVVVPTDLAPRIEAATRAFATAPPWQPASAPEAPAAAAAIEAALIGGDRKRALDAAENALAAAADDAATRVWLAWALCANGQPAAALAELARATAPPPPPSPLAPSSPSSSSPSPLPSPLASLSPSSPLASPPPPSHSSLASLSPSPSPSPGGDNPLAIYLRARAEHLQFEHAAGAREPVPPLVTTADLAVVTLASGRGAATWLQGTTEVQLSAGQARAAIAEHRELTARCLARALDALEGAPGFADAAYLVARLAVKAGLIAQARAMFDALAPRMHGRPDADAFERDRRDLVDPAGAVAAAKTQPLPGTAKRSRSLKVLS